jgi:hypothetical protein
MNGKPLIVILAASTAFSGTFGRPACPENDHACELSREAMHGEPTAPYSPSETRLGKSLKAATTNLSDIPVFRWPFTAT